MLSQELIRADESWSFIEVWTDTTTEIPYVLLLTGNETENCKIYDPAENYKIAFSCDTYEKAKLWLLEDEYVKVTGRIKQD
jgi:hypothetical protein